MESKNKKKFSISASVVGFILIITSIALLFFPALIELTKTDLAYIAGVGVVLVVAGEAIKPVIVEAVKKKLSK